MNRCFKIFILFTLITFALSTDAQVGLYGLGINPIPSQRSLVKIDETTAAKTYISSVISNYHQPFSPAVDPNNKLYYYIGRDSLDSVRIYTIDLANGNILSSPMLASPNDIHQLAYNCIDGNLYGLNVVYQPNSERRLAKVNPTTGVVTVISTNSVAKWYSPFSPAIDPGSGIYYFVGQDTLNLFHLYGIDLTAGTISQDIQLPDSNTIHQLAFNCLDNHLYGLQRRENPERFYLVKIDPLSGAYDTLTTNPASYSYEPFSPAIIPFKNLYTFIGEDNFGVMRLISINMTTGQTTHDPPLSAPWDFRQIQYNTPCYPVTDFSWTDSCNLRPVTFINPSYAATFEWNFGDPASGASNTSDEKEPTHTFSSPGTYFVRLITHGCYDSDTLVKEVTIISGPPSPLNDEYIICPNDSVFLDAYLPQVINYEWSTSDTSSFTFVDQVGQYWVKLTDSLCFSFDTVNIVLTKTAYLDLGPDTTICENELLILDASPYGDFFKWNTGDTMPQLIPTLSGTYSVIASDSVCSNTDSINIIIQPLPDLEIMGDSVICEGDIAHIQAITSFPVVSWSTGDTLKDLYLTSPDTLLATVSDGRCVATDTFTLIVDPLPEGVRDTIICPEDSLTITLDSTYQCTWSTGDTTNSITISETGFYWVHIVNEFGCEIIDTFWLANHYSPLKPVIEAFYDSLYQSYLLPDWMNYQWYYDSIMLLGETYPGLKAEELGLYILEITDINGCINRDSFLLEINPCEEIRFSPNPGDGNLFIDGYSQIIREVTVYTEEGRLIFNHEGINEQEYLLKLRGLIRSGLYLVVIRTDVCTVVRKWIVKEN